MGLFACCHRRHEKSSVNISQQITLGLWDFHERIAVDATLTLPVQRFHSPRSSTTASGLISCSPTSRLPGVPGSLFVPSPSFLHLPSFADASVSSSDMSLLALPRTPTAARLRKERSLKTSRSWTGDVNKAVLDDEVSQYEYEVEDEDEEERPVFKFTRSSSTAQFFQQPAMAIRGMSALLTGGGGAAGAGRSASVGGANNNGANRQRSPSFLALPTPPQCMWMHCKRDGAASAVHPGVTVHRAGTGL